ncbi:MAG: hypothetical protein QOH95_315 [Gaiellaceae bacterium]|jgi:hypothetical protein|nr:hypothetical protein [Gaiellaceae bacterium]
MRLGPICLCVVVAGVAASTGAGSRAATPGQAVERAVLKAAEVGPGVITRQIPHGSDVQGQVTLDLCGFKFRSEKQRSARLQLSFIRNTGGGPFLSNEVVAYKPGWAARAMRELRTAVARCPKGFVKSSVPGAGLIKNQFDPIKSSKFLPGAVGLIDHITEQVGTKKPLRFDSLLVYQARGNVLSGVYSFGVVQLPVVVHAAEQSAINLRRL